MNETSSGIYSLAGFICFFAIIFIIVNEMRLSAASTKNENSRYIVRDTKPYAFFWFSMLNLMERIIIGISQALLVDLDQIGSFSALTLQVLISGLVAFIMLLAHCSLPYKELNLSYVTLASRILQLTFLLQAFGSDKFLKMGDGTEADIIVVTLFVNTTLFISIWLFFLIKTCKSMLANRKD